MNGDTRIHGTNCNHYILQWKLNNWTGKVLQLQFIQSCHTYVQLTEFWHVFVLGPKHSGGPLVQPTRCATRWKWVACDRVERWLSVSLGGRFVLCISFSFWNVQHLILSRNLSSDLAIWIGSGARCSKTRSIRSTVCSAVADEFKGTRFKCSNLGWLIKNVAEICEGNWLVCRIDKVVATEICCQQADQ
jgi:hypothetical protein